MSEIASPIRASERHIIARYALGGVLFGVCFPLAAWTLDTFLHHLPYNWSSLAHLHHINPIHYLVDSAPLILGVTFTAIGVKQAYIEQDRTALERTVAELSDANARLESLATTDGLTGLVNHRALQEQLKEEHDRAVRHHTPLSILMLDVDNFKPYNDAYGHPAGDVVLRQVAQVLQETARTGDGVARYGGEEFVALLPGADVEEAKTVAERFRHAIETVAWKERGITVSIGAATLAPTTVHPDALLADADTALYRSKYRGRNCVTHADDAGEMEGLDTASIRWYDDLLKRLLAIQADTSGEASEQVRDTLLHAYDATILSWSRILDLKDKETEGHSQRVTEWMVRLMQHLGFNTQEVRFARWGALLHDIGKIAVPDHILHKPGPLTEAEWVIMRQHTTVAYEMLKPIEFLGPALDIPYCHHEKWDGNGYPRGLQGDEIPPVARLFAVIDVYDALTSDRPYRKSWSEEKVRTHLQEQAGTHFDPRAVKAFLNMLADDCAPQLAA
jgi:diguanylate cyclase (GGDEF)-like protein/putative nucleotidyltransferase with HDIG domain